MGVSVSVMGESPASGACWQELSKSECFGLLAQEHLGRVAFVDDLGPTVVPVNFVLDRHMVVFRTDEGTKLDAACRGSRVAFEIDGADEVARTGWSVVIRGEATEVTDPAELARLRKLPLYPWAPGAKAHYVRVLPAVLTGRRISAPAGASSRGGEPERGAAARPDGEVRRWEPR
jgi:nitroimidazol reductase NimA-like FMN-containing flavoprotein (pyridoxamine 5'-phosphate oxidase superfamily)